MYYAFCKYILLFTFSILTLNMLDNSETKLELCIHNSYSLNRCFIVL